MDIFARKKFSDFYFGDLTASLFREWLSEKIAKEAITKEYYTRLLSLNYKNEADCERAKEIVRRIYDASDTELIFKHKALETAQGMLDSSISLEAGCQILAKMYNNGMTFIPIHFVGYDSEFTDKDRVGMFDMHAFYSERIKEDCLILLDTLN